MGDKGLVPLGCGGVDLRAPLAVGYGQVQTDPGKQGGFAVLPWNLDVPGPESAVSVVPLPSEQHAEDKELPGLEVEGLPGPLAL